MNSSDSHALVHNPWPLLLFPYFQLLLEAEFVKLKRFKKTITDCRAMGVSFQKSHMLTSLHGTAGEAVDECLWFSLIMRQCGLETFSE